MEFRNVIQDIFNNEKYKSLPVLLDKLNSLFRFNIQTTESVSAALVDVEFFKEIKKTVAKNNASLYFGKTLRHLKCIIKDETFRDHGVFFYYNGPQNLSITSLTFPYTPLQEREYISIEEIIDTFREHLNNLKSYFYELDCIDRFCTVMEPVEPSFKDEYRRILLDDRTWLHIEVTPDGMATNIHLIGQCEYWNDKLQIGLLTWDHDKDILENIMTVFDLGHFAVPSTTPDIAISKDTAVVEGQVCNVCLCSELPDISGLPLPLCQNSVCGVYFHRSCLFQWLVACSGGRPPAFGVATGTCPTCLHSISCNENDG